MPQWTPSSDLSSFYAGRMAPPIKLPNGTYIPAPNTMSVDEMYRGIYPPALSAPSPLISRSVNTVPIDPMTGNPIGKVGNNIPPVSETLAEQRSGYRPAITQGVQPAGTVAMPPGARPSNIPLPTVPAPPTQNAAWDPFRTINPDADQTRLPSNDGGESGFMAAFFPGPQNPALGAIDQASGVPMPRARPPAPPMPFMPSPLLRGGLIPTGDMLPGAENFDGSPVEIMVRGGNKTAPTPRNAIPRPPPVPPRLRASPETFAKNKAAAEAALAIDMAGGSTHKTGKYAKATPRKDRLAARDAK
jgi:hypothetical protein